MQLTLNVVLGLKQRHELFGIRLQDLILNIGLELKRIVRVILVIGAVLVFGLNKFLTVLKRKRIVVMILILFFVFLFILTLD